MNARTSFDDSDDEDVRLSPVQTARIRYPSNTSQRERIVFNSFFTIASRQVLMVGYEHGVQVWDATNLDRVHEVLNLRMAGAVISGGPLPSPATNGKTDAFAEKRPLLGMV
jgi:hypothetical protein